MIKKTKLCTSLMIAFGSGMAAVPAAAQQTLERVEITGSAIKRIDAETTVPVTIIRIDELKKQGVTTIDQIISNISAVQIQTGTSQLVGSGTGGASFADVRGIGSNKTLILLNGRRVANNAFDSSAPDLNMIPFATLDRVEVLRDGASSLYGTDAVGGVINFITRREYQGVSLTLGTDQPTKSGGQAYNGNFGFGTGELAKDGFNLFGFLDYQHQQHVGGLDRPFNTRQPGGLSPTTFPANYFQGGATGNPAAAAPGGCSSSPFLVPAATATACQIATAAFVDYIPSSERLSAYLKGTLKLGESNRASVEYFATESRIGSQIAPVPYGGLRQNPRRPDGSPNPFYPGNPGAITPNITLNPAYTTGSPATNPKNSDGTPSAGPVPNLQPGFINVRFRDLVNGPRKNQPENFQQRLVAALDGSAAGWDYQAAASYNSNTVKDNISGYSSGPVITAGVRDGVINPFGAQTPAGLALLQSAALSGTLLSGKGIVYGADFRASRELGDWLGAGRPAALAVGLEGRRENFVQQANKEFATLVIASTGIDPDTLNKGSRNVYAGYVELNLPVHSTLELTGAVRYDKYSDFGNTTNPKIAFRYQPVKQALLRGSYSTGFRAPSLYEINAAQAYTNTATFDDPIRCPGGVPAPGVSPSTACRVQFQNLTGGNLNLQPEKSKNATVGIVIEPVNDLSFGIDYFNIRVKQSIGSVPTSAIIADPATFASYYFRLPDGSLSTDGSACPNPATCGYIDARTQNLGNLNTSGLDLNASYRMRTGQAGNFAFNANSTYILKYEYQDFIGGPYNQNVGVFVGTGPIFRWQHNANLNWNLGAFGAGIAAHHKSGYADQDPSNRVGSYTTFDLYGSWAPTKSMSFLVGLKNAFDRDPPFSNQNEVFQANYDPRFTDPTGRTVYVRATFSF